MKFFTLSLGLMAALSNASPTPATSGNLCASTVATTILNVLQSGSTEFNFGQCRKDSGGSGYSSGILNFSTRYGDALQVIKNFQQSSDYHGEFDDFMDTLQSYADNDSGSTSDLDGYCDAWEKVSNSSSFRTAQYNVADTKYQQPALSLAKQIGVQLAITQAALYDTAVVDGPGDGSSNLGGIFAATNAKFNETSAEAITNDVLISNKYRVDEIVWLKEFLKTRESLSEADSSENIQIYTKLIDEKMYQWGSEKVSFEGPDGDTYTVDCSSN